MLPQQELEHVGRNLKKLKMKNLQEYFDSKKWKDTKRIRRTARAIECDICGAFEGQEYATGNGKFIMNLHHTTYENLGNEYGYELVWLCKDCHEQLHGTVESILVNEQTLLEFVQQYMRVEVNECKHFHRVCELEKEVERLTKKLSQQNDGK